MVFVRGGQKEQDNESFFKVTPLIWAIEDQNNESYRGRGGSGEIGMVSQLLPVLNYDSFPN